MTQRNELHDTPSDLFPASEYQLMRNVMRDVLDDNVPPHYALMYGPKAVIFILEEVDRPYFCKHPVRVWNEILEQLTGVTVCKEPVGDLRDLWLRWAESSEGVTFLATIEWL
jgi:hypothetical protein